MEDHLLQKLHDGLSQANSRRGRQGGLGGVAGQAASKNTQTFFDDDGAANNSRCVLWVPTRVLLPAMGFTTKLIRVTVPAVSGAEASISPLSSVLSFVFGFDLVYARLYLSTSGHVRSD